MRGVVDQDLAGVSHLLQALRDVHRVPTGGGTARSRALRDHLTRAHSHAGADSNSEGLLQLVGKRGQPLLQLDGSPYRAYGVVIVEHRHSEHSHQGVARIGVDRPPVSLEHGTHVRQVALTCAAARLGVGRLGRRGRVDHAGEQDGHRLAGLVAPALRSHRLRPRSRAARIPARDATGRAAPGSPGRSTRYPEAGGPGRSRWWPATAASRLPTRAPSASPPGSTRGRSSRRRARAPRPCGSRSARAARPLGARTRRPEGRAAQRCSPRHPRRAGTPRQWSRPPPWS